jgi:uncharacterized membrane protein (UPF0127 family)
MSIRLVLAYLVLAATVGAVVLVLAGDRSDPPGDGDNVAVRLGASTVRAEIAATEGSRARGFSGRERPTAGHGILFVYPDAGRRSFWMRGVAFPLDMVWIRGGRVTGVTRRAPPASDTANGPLYPSPGPVDRVLEVPGGWAIRHRIGPGDRVAVDPG